MVLKIAMTIDDNFSKVLLSEFKYLRYFFLLILWIAFKIKHCTNDLDLDIFSDKLK